MRDLLRNFRNIVTKKYDSDSDTESQPLISSSSSSAKSFGTVQDAFFTHDSDFTDSENINENTSKKLNFLKETGLEISLKRPTFSSFLIPEVQVFANPENVYTEIKTDNSSQKDIIQDPFPNFMEFEDKKKTQSSLITIFSIWNTTMGSSLLAMSWGFEKAGLFPGIIINIVVAALCLYTCYLLLNVNQKHGVPGINYEVCDLCKELLGTWAEMLAKLFSMVVLIGAEIVYWILMSNFLYNSIIVFYDLIFSKNVDTNVTVLCPKEFVLETKNFSSTIIIANVSVFERIWDLYTTVPIFLAFLMFPMLNFKSPTFFTKFNSLGTISVMYIFIFVAVKAYQFGINIPDWEFEWNLKPTFCALSGMLSLSYFIHNIIISIMRSNKNPENNNRDLAIAFGLVTFTYIFLGVAFYVAYPLAKTCIEDNILNNFNKHDTMTIIARILLLFQLFTVYPLLAFMLRNDIFANITMLFKNKTYGEFAYSKVIIINAFILFLSIMFACFLPKIGTLIRYTGAASGLVYIFMLPSLLKMASLRKEGNLTPVKVVFFSTIVVIGFINLFSQFLISD